MKDSIKLTQHKWRIPNGYFRKCILTLSLVASFALAMQAATITFNNPTNTNWFTPGNWDSGTVPSTADDVIIPAGFTVDINGSAVALTVSLYGSLTITSSSDLTFNGGTFDAITNHGTLTNEGDINLGLTTPITSKGIVNKSIFNNKGNLNTGLVGSIGTEVILNVGGTITNDGVIDIPTPYYFGIGNLIGGTITNNGLIRVVNSSNLSIRNAGASTTFDNYGTIELPIGGFYVISNASFTNHPCGELFTTRIFNDATTTIINDGFMSFSESATSAVAWINNGVVHSPLARIGFFPTNNSILITNTTLTEDCGTFTPAFDLGGSPSATLSVYTDAAGTNSAGTFDPATNTFTSMPPLASGANSLFVKIETSGCADQIVPWELDVTTAPCCNLLTWTGATDNDWHTASNWSPMYVPTTCNDVLIPTGTSTDPVISASAVALSVLVDGTLNLDPGSDLSIDGTVGTAITVNPSGTVNNDGDIFFGQTTMIDGRGIANGGAFNNLSNGQLIFDQVGLIGGENIRNQLSGVFTNDGYIDMLNGSAPGFGFIIFNGSVINNGTIEIDRFANKDLRVATTLDNYGIINLVNANGGIKINAGAVFTNHPCAEYYSAWIGGNAGLFDNAGFASLFSGTFGPIGNINNTGVIHTPAGVPTTATVTNSSIIISDVALTEDCGAFSPAFDLGGSPNATLSVYTDAAGTNSAGTFDAATNTFTSMPPLASGANSLFVKIETSGCADQIVPWELDVTTAPCCNLLTWTGATDNDWHTASNWSPMYVPTTCNDVLIPTGTSTDPVISASAVALSVLVDGTLNLDPGSDLSIDGTVGTAITVNPSGTVNNDGDIFFGQTTMIDGRGIANGGAFNNLSNGQLIFDQVGLIGGENIRNQLSGVFTNDGYIDMLNGSAPGFGFIIFNGSVINNGTIEIDRFANKDLRVATTLDNYGIINLVNANGGIKINAGAVFTNHPCAEYYSAWIGGNAGLFDNAGFASLFSGTFGPIGNINNTGVIHTPAGVPTTATVTNSSIIISDVALTEDCGAFSPAFDLGGSPNATLSVYTDAAGTNSAGTFDAATNTFTSMPPLAGGANSLFVKIETSGCADQIVPWELDVTTAPCCTVISAVCQDISVDLPNLVGGVDSISITPADIDNGSTSDCGLASMALDVMNFKCANTGDNTVTLTVTDNGGNTSTCTAIVTVNDVTKPALACHSNITLTLDANGVTRVLSDTELVISFFDRCETDPSSLTLSQNQFDCTEIGNNSVGITGSDMSGNSITCTPTIIVEDNLAPTALCQNVTITLDANGDANITTADIDNGSSDNCSITLSASQTDFDCGNEGLNTVTLTVTDPSGNSSTCDADVTVELPTAPPVVNCWDDFQYNYGICQWENLGTQALVPVITIDNPQLCLGDAVSFMIQGSPGVRYIGLYQGLGDNFNITADANGTATFIAPTTSPAGIYNVTIYSIRYANCINGVSIRANYQVLPAPTAVCQDISVDLNPSGNASITIGDIDNGSGSNTTCAITSMALDIMTFNCSNVGVNPVILTVTDANGNASSCSADVTVEDNWNPSMLCKSITDVYLDANGMTRVLSNSELIIQFNDNCAPDPTSLILSQNQFDCSELGRNFLSLTGSDVNGNSSTCAPSVMVIDSIAPTALCQNVTITLDANGDANITTADIDNGSSDNCSITLSASQTDFDCSNEGLNTVTLTVTDPSGNSSTCDADVTVELPTEPLPVNCWDDYQYNYTLCVWENLGSEPMTPTLSLNQTDYCFDEAIGIAISGDPNATYKVDVSNVGSNTPTTNSNGNVAYTFFTLNNGTNPIPGQFTVTISQVTIGNCVLPLNVTETFEVCETPVISICAGTLGSTPDPTLAGDADGDGLDDNCTFMMCSGDTPVFKVVSSLTSGPTDIHVTSTFQNNPDLIGDAVGGGSLGAAGQIFAITGPAIINTSNTVQCYDTRVYAGNANCGPQDDNPVNGCEDDFIVVTICVQPEPVQPPTVNCWDDFQFDPATCTYVNQGTQPIQPSVVNCWDDFQFDPANCVWENLGSEALVPIITIDNPQLCLGDAVSFMIQGSPGVNYIGSYEGLGDNFNITANANGTATFTAPTTSPAGIYDVAIYSIRYANCINGVSIRANYQVLPAPTAVCQDISVDLNPSGNASITIGDIDNGSGSNTTCAITSMALDIMTFNCSNVGVNPVILTVTDANGNASSCSADVTVEDNSAPSMLCESITDVYLDANGMTRVLSNSELIIQFNDNCAPDPTSLILSQNQFDCSELGRNFLSLTGSDVNGNSSTCAPSVMVIDSIAPTATCQNVTITLDANGDANITTADIDNGSSDNCSITLSASQTDFDCSHVGVNPIILTITDPSGNSTTCSADVTVEDNSAPSMLCESITDVYLDANGMTRVLSNSELIIQFNDNCAPDPTSLILSQNQFDCSELGRNFLLLTGSDVNGNSSTCAPSVMVIDSIAPTATCQNVTITLDANGDANITTADIDNGSSDNCSITLSASQTDFDCSHVGVNPIILTITDPSGNSTTCSADVTVEDNSAPSMLCESITDVYLDANGMTRVLSNSELIIQFNDNCAPDPTSLILSQNQFDCSELGRNFLSLTGSDVNGNSSTCAPSVMVIDSIAPTALCQNVTITLDANGDASITTADIDNGSFDNCSITLSASQTDFDCSHVGVNPIILTITDPSGNSTTCSADVTVEDNSAPSMLCESITDVYLDANGMTRVLSNSELIIQFNDNCAPDPTSLILSQNQFDCSELGRNFLLLTGSDVNGNSSTCAPSVMVIDSIAPTATCQNVAITLDANGDANITTADIDNGSFDNCSITLSASQTDFDCSHVGANTVTLTVTDNSNNLTTCDATVTVEDNTNPIARCQDITRELNNSGIISITGAMIDNNSSDACGISSLVAVPFSFNCTHLGANQVTLTVIDNNGNSSDCISTVIIEDNISPQVRGRARSEVVECDGAGNTTEFNDWLTNHGSAIVTDNCNFSWSNDFNGFSDGCGATGEAIVTFTATDIAGNSVSTTAVFTIIDTKAPEFSTTTLPDQILECDGLRTGLPAPLDLTLIDCDEDAVVYNIVEVSFTEDPFSSTIEKGIYERTERTYYAKDACGNTNTIVETFYIQDSKAPEIGYCPDSDIIIEAQPGEFGAYIAYDEPWFFDDCYFSEFADSIKAGDWLECGKPTQVSITAEDVGGNTTSCVFTVIVTDPLMTLPEQTIEVSIPSGSSFNTNHVEWNHVFARGCDECDVIEADPDFRDDFEFLGALNGHRYYVSNAAISASNAAAITGRYAGDLVSISSFEENRFLNHELLQETALIGLNDLRSESIFEWNDGSDYSYQNWATAQPLSPGLAADTSDYVIMNAQGKWENVRNGTYRFILEIPCYDVSIDSSTVLQGNNLPIGTYETNYKILDICGNEEHSKVNINVVNEKVNYTFPNRYPNKIDEDTLHYLTGVYFDGAAITSDNDQGYSLATRRFPALRAGETYQLQLTSDNDNNMRRTMYYAVWIDFNEDGDFYDPNEKIYEGFSYGGFVKPTRVTIPDDVQTKGLGTTLMRVAARKYTSPEPAVDFEFGEVEDYNIRILKKLRKSTLDFVAVKIPELAQVDLTWITDYENEEFIIEKSTDGQTFYPIESQNGIGAMTSKDVFKAFDNSPTQGKSYYRLVLIQPDDTKIVSDVREVSFARNEAFGAFPNPASKEVYINMTELAGKAGVLTMNNQMGQIIYQKSFESIPFSPKRIDLKNFNPGVYFINVKAEGRRMMTKRLVVIDEN